jgi:hypothetical protein
MYDHREAKKILMIYDGEKALRDMPALVELLLKVPANDYDAIKLAEALCDTAIKARLVRAEYFVKHKERFKRYILTFLVKNNLMQLR